MKIEWFNRVWDANEDTPAEAENMKVRSALLVALRDHIAEAGMTQKEAAKQLEVTQPRISDLMRGRVDLFAVDRLLKMLAKAALRVEVKLGNAA
jgi:predicted XRE-type DNA-binding protein